MVTGLFSGSLAVYSWVLLSRGVSRALACLIDCNADKAGKRLSNIAESARKRKQDLTGGNNDEKKDVGM